MNSLWQTGSEVVGRGGSVVQRCPLSCEGGGEGLKTSQLSSDSQGFEEQHRDICTGTETLRITRGFF